MTEPTYRLLRVAEVTALTTLGSSTIYREMLANRFPQAVHPTPTTSAWRSDEVLAWMDKLPRVETDKVA